ncbi:MAG: DUF6458 family protein [Carbonactinosporaceae bacterium]
MGIGIGLILVAIGAILAFATKGDLPGIDLQEMGVIIMLVGLAWLLISLWRRPRRLTPREQVFGVDEVQRRPDERPPD